MGEEQPEMKFVSKGWGFERWIVNTTYCGKLLFLAKNKCCSFHFHKNKDEVFYVQSGAVAVYWTDDMDLAQKVAEVEKKGETSLYPMLNCAFLEPGDNFHVPTGRVHQIFATKDTELFEFSTEHFDSDSIRVTPGDTL